MKNCFIYLLIYSFIEKLIGRGNVIPDVEARKNILKRKDYTKENLRIKKIKNKGESREGEKEKKRKRARGSKYENEE